MAVNKAVLAIALAAGVVGMAFVLRGGESFKPHGEGPGEGSVKVNRRHGADVVLSIAPGAPASMRAQATQLAPRVSPLVAEYVTASEYASLVSRLDGRARSPEETWVLAEILSRCDQFARVRRARTSPLPDRRMLEESFAASLSLKDPLREKRIQAHNATTVERCAGVRDPKPKEVSTLWAEAAAAGDPKARMRILWAELNAEKRRVDRPRLPDGRMIVDSARFSDGLRAGLESGDPHAMMLAATILTDPQGTLSLRAGPEELPVDSDVFWRAIRTLGCELGIPCGPGNEDLNLACAYYAACDARDLREYYFFYALTPHQSQLMNQYVEGLRNLVRTRDWSHFSVQSGTPVAYNPALRP